jgi:hypothetical protein
MEHGASATPEKSRLWTQRSTFLKGISCSVARRVARLRHVEAAHEIVVTVVVAAVVDALAVAATAVDVAGAVVVVAAIAGSVGVLVFHCVGARAVSVLRALVATVARVTGVAVAVVSVRANAVAVASGVVVGVGGGVAGAVVAVATVAMTVAVVVVGRGGGGRNVLTDDAAADSNSPCSFACCSCAVICLHSLESLTHDGVLAGEGDQLVAEDLIGEFTIRTSAKTLLDSATVGVLEWVSTEVLVELTERSELSAHLVADACRIGGFLVQVSVLEDLEVHGLSASRTRSTS